MLFKHLRTGRLYRFIGYGRSVENPQVRQVIYKQLYRSKLNEAGVIKAGSTILPYGSIWVRERSDFRTKFIRVK
jgi:hypothetical protein